jgi:peptidoglycan/xylan/chitin deacetylase (PgdA/CDA1 family)
MALRGMVAMLGAGMAVSFALSFAPAKAAEVPRPPQFVMLAFDNCTELSRWQDLSDFAAEMDHAGKRVRFTFFLSGINLIEAADRNSYQGPGQRRGYSRINFGGSADEVRRRIGYINTLFAQGHEIAAHAVGHFDGGRWSAAQWDQEFGAYRAILANADGKTRAGDSRLDFPPNRIVGFRAPYLAADPGLYTALRRDGFRYDTSGTTDPEQWPRQVDGTWRFDLAELKIDGSRRKTLSMDYNFLVAQSHGRPDPRHAGVFKEQMLATYLDYFRANYAGNRAPINIGHHFEALQGGVYNEALKEFARRVCGLPEVRCATYSELADFMDKQSPETLAAYQRGDFPHAPEPAKESTRETTTSARLSP